MAATPAAKDRIPVFFDRLILDPRLKREPPERDDVASRIIVSGGLTFHWVEAVSMSASGTSQSRRSAAIEQTPPPRPRASPGQSVVPELPVAGFSFLLHFVWEFIQVPTYAGMAEMQHWEGIKLCLSATIGDVGFALTAFWAASLAARSRQWLLDPSVFALGVFVAAGVALTVGFEYYYTEVSLRWTYSELMPLVPPLGTGLSPLLQWLILPPLVVWLSRRLLAGARAWEAKTRMPGERHDHGEMSYSHEAEDERPCSPS